MRRGPMKDLDELREALDGMLALSVDDPPDTDYQKGYENALKDIRVKLGKPGQKGSRYE